MKKTLLVVSFLLLGLSIQAEELAVYLKSGKEYVFTLASKPIITIANDSLTVRSEQTEYSIPLEDVDYYKVNAIATGSESVTNGRVKPVIHEGHVVLNKLEPDSHVAVYSINGLRHELYKVDKVGYVDVDLSKYPDGVYILQSPEVKIKIIKR